jgi:hypothetical protein
MKRAVEPIGHIPVYKPIDFRPVRKPSEPAGPVDLLTEALRRMKAERIWQITRQTAEGCNAPSIAPAETAPVVDMSGWEAA